jgi:hypothetical protein
MKTNYFNFKSAALFFALFACVAGLNAQITLTYTYTGALQTFTIPSCVTNVTIDAKGAQGAINSTSTTTGGLGGAAYGILNVSAGDVLYITVGGMSGFGGGGLGGVSPCTTAGGGNGGGASDIRVNGNALANRVIVAAGGGGGGGDRIGGCGRGTGGGGGGGYFGGGGGAGYGTTTVPTGGTQSAGGNGGAAYGAGISGVAGASGVGGDGGGEYSSNQTTTNTAMNGGDGGGANGANGQISSTLIYTGSSGAGGSSYVGAPLSTGSTTAGVRTGDGIITIQYNTSGAGVVASMSNSLGVCPGGSVTLSAGNVPTYTWSTGPVNTSIVVSPTVTTSYTVSGTNTIGCISHAVLTVSINTAPSIVATASKTFLCVGESTDLSASGASSYTWNGTTPGATFNVNPVTTTNYTVSGTNTAGCASSQTITVLVNSNVLTTTPSTAICSGQAVSLSASGAVNYTWTPGLPFAIVQVTPAITTTYVVNAIDNFNCPLSAMVTVSVNPLPNVAASANRTSICKGEPVTLTAIGASTYSWNTGSTTAVTTTTLIVDIPTTFTVVGTDANGCAATATVLVNVGKCTGLTNPEKIAAFSVFPNPTQGIFEIGYPDKAGATIEIYNAAGTLVKKQIYSTTPARMNLENEPAGVYFIHITRDNENPVVSRLVKE